MITGTNDVLALGWKGVPQEKSMRGRNFGCRPKRDRVVLFIIQYYRHQMEVKGNSFGEIERVGSLL